MTDSFRFLAASLPCCTVLRFGIRLHLMGKYKTLLCVIMFVECIDPLPCHPRKDQNIGQIEICALFRICVFIAYNDVIITTSTRHPTVQLFAYLEHIWGHIGSIIQIVAPLSIHDLIDCILGTK